MNDDTPLPRPETPKEIAAFVKVTPATVLNWFHQEIIPAEFAVGRIIRFDRAKVLQALAEHKKRNLID